MAGTIYYDGKSSPLSLNEDKLMLDGIRLLKTGTNSWQSEQGFVKVKKIGGTVHCKLVIQMETSLCLKPLRKLLSAT